MAPKASLWVRNGQVLVRISDCFQDRRVSSQHRVNKFVEVAEGVCNGHLSDRYFTVLAISENSVNISIATNIDQGFIAALVSVFPTPAGHCRLREKQGSQEGDQKYAGSTFHFISLRLWAVE